MIRDLSQTLQAILAQPGVPAELSAAQIVFDAPTETFTPAQTTVDLFLYDIRENTELRSNEPLIGRQNGNIVVRQSPMRVACSYLITAWPVGGAEVSLQEQRLLSQILQVFSRYPIIPASFLQGSLAGQQPPLPMITAQADGVGDPAEFWTALGNKLRPAITLTVTFAMEVIEPKPAQMAITHEMGLAQGGMPSTRKAGLRIRGRVTGNSDAPVAEATVELAEIGLITTTNSDGYYNLGLLRPGTYTLRVQSGTTLREIAISVPATTGSNYDVQLP